MKWRRRLSSSLRPLVAHRTRAALAVAGVAVGVAAVIVSRAIGAGAEAEMRRTIERAGTNLLIVKPLPAKRLVLRPEFRGSSTSLVAGDADAIATLGGVRQVAPAIERPGRVKANGTSMRTTIRGTTAAFASIRGFELAAGRGLGSEDEDGLRRVVVLGARVQEELSAGASLVGGSLRVDGRPFEVIGVFRPRGTSTDGADQDNFVAMPLRTAMRRVFNTTWLTNLYVSVAEPNGMTPAEDEIERLLRARHRRHEPGDDDFAVQNTTRMRSFQQEVIDALSRYATGFAVIALLVGGSGILALMLLSVKERTSEIGLRMAVGARSRDILLQFLVEAGALALGGWVLGAFFAGSAAVALAYVVGWPVGVPTMAIAGSFGMVLIIGLGFGALPARNAARIPPVEALVTR